jgi:hypothetical protein
VNEAPTSLQPAWRDITSFPEFVFAAMAQHGSGTVEAEASHTDSVRQPPTQWILRRRDTGAAEVIADTRPPHFRTILARFASVCGISPYGGQTAFSRGEHHYSVTLRNSQQTGFGIRIELVSDDLPQSTGSA